METFPLLIDLEWFWLMPTHLGQGLMEMLTLMMMNNGQRIHQVSYTFLRMILMLLIFGKVLIIKNIEEMDCFGLPDGSQTSKM